MQQKEERLAAVTSDHEATVDARRPLGSICVFCGSNAGVRPAYAETAVRVGTTLAQRGVRLVYGGGRVGLMGTVADAALAAGGKVIGVIPRTLAEREIAHAGLTELHVVASMHERKALMVDLAEGFLALPGGYGTLEEFCEVLTWAQLGIHAKPCALLDVEGFYAPLVAMFDGAVSEGFVHPDHRALVLSGENLDDVLAAMARYESPSTVKWITRDET